MDSSTGLHVDTQTKSTHESEVVIPDLSGAHYRTILASLNSTLRPHNYFEVGTESGDTLAIFDCVSVAVDPSFQFHDPDTIKRILSKPALHLFRTTSDRFFAENKLEDILGGKVNIAFLDGMHLCEFLLRDFINTERCCSPNSIVIFHDCFPVEAAVAARVQGTVPFVSEHRKGWWTGDVWRTALLLKRKRPDLHMLCLDASPTGLVIITNLDPDSTALGSMYADSVKEMLSWELNGVRLHDYFAEMELTSAATLGESQAITARFWL